MESKFSKRVFVIMPFSKTKSRTEAEWTDIFENVFKPAVEDCGYTCERALPTTGSLVKSVIQDLVYSRIVIADITDRNANVFYELGVRHAVSKRTIMVTQNIEHVPSDLQGHWSLVYSTNPGGVADFKKAVKRLIREFDENPERNDSPVSEFLDQEATGIRNFIVKDNLKRISALFTELTAIINTLGEAAVNPVYAALIEYGCIDLLIQTMYVDVGVDQLRDLYHLKHNLKALALGVRTGEEFVRETLSLAKSVAAAIMTVRDRLMTGQFVEPVQVSSMVWTPLEQGLMAGDGPGAIRQYSRSVDLSKIDPDELKNQFGKA